MSSNKSYYNNINNNNNYHYYYYYLGNNNNNIIITAIENIEKRVVIERELIEIGIRLIKNREIIKEGKDLF